MWQAVKIRATSAAATLFLNILSVPRRNNRFPVTKKDLLFFFIFFSLDHSAGSCSVVRNFIIRAHHSGSAVSTKRSSSTYSHLFDRHSLVQLTATIDWPVSASIRIYILRCNQIFSTSRTHRNNLLMSSNLYTKKLMTM